MKGAIGKAIEMAEKDKNIFIPSQFENPSNPQIHRETTALEIWRDTDGQVDIIVSGIGTGGTFTGVGEVLKAKKQSIKMIAVEPVESAVLSGDKPGPHKIQGMGAGFIPKNMNTKLIDGIEKVSSEEALSMARRVIKEEGIPVGISSGSIIAAALRQAAKKENAGKLIVAFVPSYSERYLSTMLAEQERNEAASLKVELVSDEYLQKAVNQINSV
jgi:cysteine synthase A